MPTILVVDDRQENREFLVTLLQYGGHRLIEASDGAEALVVVQRERPDLVIADIIMPTMDGYEFVRKLRSDPDVAQTPVIFYTAAYHRLEASALADKAGAVQLLTKPSDPEIILEAVSAALARQPEHGQAPLPDSFDREHLRLVTDMLAQKVNDLEVVNLRMAALIQLGQQLVQEHNSARLLEKFCHAARDIIAAKYAVVSILSEDQTSQIHFFSSGLDAATVAQIGPPPSIRGLLQRILIKNNSIRVRDITSEPDATGFPEHHPQIGSFLCVPIATQSRLYGALYLGNKIGMDEFTEDDERAAATLAAQLAVAYENGHRIEVIQKHATQLEQEIADRQQAEEELRASQLRLEVLSRQLITTQETERRHLARELHDEIGQVLTAIKMNLQNAQRTADAVAQAHLVENIGMVDRSIDRPGTQPVAQPATSATR